MRRECMATWDRFLTSRDRAVYDSAGYGTVLGFGERPAVLIVDVNYDFVGHRREPILESVKTWRNSCGEEGWDGVAAIQSLLEAARSREIPVFYTTSVEPRADGFGEEFEVVIRKTKPSAFFGTPLASYLVELGVDTLLVGGTTTSGCVRASVIDAFSYNYRVAVVEECTFDRGEASHAINLFDMNAKYADVVSLASSVEYVNSRPGGLFAGRIGMARELPLAGGE
jgi:maleamate amidohydrolase